MADTINRKDLISVRAGTLDDANFIFSSWLKGLRYGSYLFDLIPSDLYFKTYHRVIELLLSRPTVRVAVACLKDSPDSIIGYAVYEGEKLHWVHVKQEWRRIGVATLICPQNLTTATHLTQQGLRILKHKCPKFIFNPFL